MRQTWKHLTMAGIVLVALFGVAAAIDNLPVRTGCSYYGKCPSAADREISATAGVRVERAS